MTKRQQALLNELESLPKGYISRKVIRGREAFYHQWKTDVKTGAALRKFAKGVEKWGRRDALKDIVKYVRGDTIDRVMIVYGLRRTGKTTMLRQVICDLSDKEFAKAAYVKMSSVNDMSELGRDMDRLQRSGYKYVFIDEVTLMKDFVSDAALLSDIYAGMGMKVVLSRARTLLAFGCRSRTNFTTARFFSIRRSSLFGSIAVC